MKRAVPGPQLKIAVHAEAAPRARCRGSVDSQRAAAANLCLQRHRGEFGPDYRHDVDALLEAPGLTPRDVVLGLGNPSLNDNYAARLPGALRRLMASYPSICGLFKAAPRTRGKWATSWTTDLSNPIPAIADGIAYEVLAAERLLQENLLGTRVAATDGVSMGFKLQASYPVGEELIGQPDRETVEADLHLFLMGTATEIGVDFKHTTGRRAVRLLKEQLAGVQVVLETGELDSFWFVTNHRFSPGSRRMVEVVNANLEAVCQPADILKDPSFGDLLKTFKVSPDDLTDRPVPCVRLLEGVAIS